MTRTRQFFALFKFQTTINPFIWFVPIAFMTPLVLPLLIGHISDDYHPGFSLLLSNQNMFLIGIFGAMILAPEKFQLGATQMVSTFYGSEFILTRAIDRPVVYRAKAAILYVLILVLPCLGILNALRQPDLVVGESAAAVQQACLSNLPGSDLESAKWDRHGHHSLIAIPRGNVLVAEWQLWVFIVAALVMQVAIMILYPFKYGRILFWAFFFGLIFVPLFDLTSIRTDMPTINERLFFGFAGNEIVCWGVTAGAVVIGQLWCERWFARLEQ
jgi:hypothetical protein